MLTLEAKEGKFGIHFPRDEINIWWDRGSTKGGR